MTAAAAAAPRSAHGGAAYRRDLDGLRAVAVLSVILYHARVRGFSGGYVGVDVFFVISGFLISSIIFRQLDEGRFSLAQFYERRIRRIAPALTLVLAVCTVAALLLLLPTELLRFSKSLIATLLFGSNIFFWHTSGYFDTAATTKPLLHTWSLAIEEQFYVVFPLAAVLVARYWPRARAPFFLVGLLASLAACVVVTRVSRDAAFYLPVTRGWELLVGVMLSSLDLPSLPPGAASATISAVLSALGLSAVIVGVTRFTPATHFPGISAVLPTLGTALVIAADRADDPLAGRLLRQPPMVLIGRMSYSLYLWHWPAIVFFYEMAGREPRGAKLAALLGLVFLASATSWRLVEEPCRRAGRIPYGRLVRGLAAVSVVLMMVGVSGWRNHGYAFVQRPEVNRYLAAERDVNPDHGRCFDRGVALMDRREPCRLGPDDGTAPSFIVWGDSHANALMPVLGALANEEGVAGLFAGSSGCVPLVDVRRIDRRDNCARLADSVVALVARRRLRDVILVSYWTAYTDGWEMDPPPPEPLLAGRRPGDKTPPRAVLARALRQTIDALRAGGARVWIVEQVPTQPRDVPTWLARVARNGGDVSQVGRPTSEHRARQRWLVQTFAAIADGRGVLRLDPATVLCPAERCLTSLDGRSLYADEDHLSTFGAMQLHDFFQPMFRAMAGAGR